MGKIGKIIKLVGAVILVNNIAKKIMEKASPPKKKKSTKK